jgi:hypothetical protein
MDSYSGVMTQQVTPENGCLNSHRPTKAAAESNEEDSNPESDKALVTIVLEPPVFPLKDQELEEGKIKTSLTSILIKYLRDSVQQAVKLWSMKMKKAEYAAEMLQLENTITDNKENTIMSDKHPITSSDNKDYFSEVVLN